MKLTVITPTTGKASLTRLIDSIEKQGTDDIFHILLWDDRRESEAVPEKYNSARRFSIVAPNGLGRNHRAPGSILRAIGLIAARTPWVTFADDDAWWENEHYKAINELMSSCHWGSTKRKIWSPAGDYLGIDNFESVGNDITRRTPYEMCDNNTMFFKRELGVMAAHLYRETTEYNDDRLMYQFLKQVGKARGKTNKATINHICPEKLIDFFKANCEQ